MNRLGSKKVGRLAVLFKSRYTTGIRAATARQITLKNQSFHRLTSRLIAASNAIVNQNQHAIPTDTNQRLLQSN